MLQPCAELAEGERSATQINKKIRFRVRDGYIMLAETDDSRCVVNENKLAAMVQHEPSPPQ